MVLDVASALGQRHVDSPPANSSGSIENVNSGRLQATEDAHNAFLRGEGRPSPPPRQWGAIEMSKPRSHRSQSLQGPSHTVTRRVRSHKKSPHSYEPSRPLAPLPEQLLRRLDACGVVVQSCIDGVAELLKGLKMRVQLGDRDNANVDVFT